jgi:dipeptidyl aminopeptidase/acylaminoacyl peptidase
MRCDRFALNHHLVTTILTLCLIIPGTSRGAIAQEPTLELRENLVTEGIPPVPLSLVDRVNRYTNFRSASLQSWHPTRREMLISTRFGDVTQIHQVVTPRGMRKQLTFYPERVAGARFVPGNGQYFVFSKDIGGNEFSQNFRYDLATGAATLLTDGKSRNSLGPWSNKGDRMAYTSTRRTGKDNDFYVVNPLNPGSDRLVAQVSGGGWWALDWAPDDRTLLAIEYISANESHLYRIDLATGAKTRLTPEPSTGKVSYGSAVFSKDGKGLYWVSDRGSEFSQLAYVDLATMTPKVLTAGIPWDVESMELSPDGKYLAFVTNEAGMSVLRVLDTATHREVTLPTLPTGVILGIDWRPGAGNPELGLTFLSATKAADVYSIDLKTQAITRWTESETGGIVTDRFSNAELVTWKSFDNLEISGFLYRPPTGKFPGKRPVMIDIHGGPEGQSRPYFMGRLNYYLNELGVAIVFPNVRGSSGYGKTFLTLDNGFKREDSVKDIGALLDWIKQQPDLDPDRVLITGGSYGGYMSLASSVKYGDRIRGAINVVGISNFVSFLERTEGYRRDLRRVEYGDERVPEMRSFLEKISPLTNAAQIKKPLFVIHGKNDPRVPLNEAEQIVKTVGKNGTPVWYLMAKDEGHGFTKKRNVDYEFYATVMFVQEVLLK